ncbi:MAG: PilZ domain-containing protein [Candidatus Hydrogenedentes bacterium]|nr:PilZ domain-containing protein [Candidatus Hydrogenedentota bacterium]
MGIRRSYNVDAPWFDPFETRRENRSAPRFEMPMKITLAVEDPVRKGQLVGPGLVGDISMSGVSVRTKHNLSKQQKVNVELSTDMCSEDLCVAPASVESGDGTQIRAGLQFGDSLIQNIEFAMFIDHLQSRARQSQVRRG